MTWFAFKGYNDGQAIDLAGVQEKIAVGWRFHGYATQAEAEANPNSVNLLLAAQVDGLIADYHTAVEQNSEPGGSNANILNPETATRAVATQAANATGLAAIGDFFTALSSSNTWIRVAKVIVGGVMLIVGIAHITGAGGAVADTARKLPAPI